MSYKHSFLGKFSSKINKIFEREKIFINNDEDVKLIQYLYFNQKEYNDGILFSGKNELLVDVMFLFDVNLQKFYKILDYDIAEDKKMIIKTFDTYGYIDVM